jgi:hypothetical protein
MLDDCPCHLYVAAYSMYSQLSSITGDHPSICNPRLHHAVVTRDPPNCDIVYKKRMLQGRKRTGRTKKIIILLLYVAN